MGEIPTFSDITKAAGRARTGRALCTTPDTLKMWCVVCVRERKGFYDASFSFFSRLHLLSLLFTLHRAPHNERERKREKKLAKRNCSLLKGGIGEHRHSSRLPSSDHDRPRFILLNNSLGSAFSFLHLSTFHCRSHHVQYSRY